MGTIWSHLGHKYFLAWFNEVDAKTIVVTSTIRKNHINQKEKALIKRLGLLRIWSGKRDSNSRPQPWQGCALPTELFPQIFEQFYKKLSLKTIWSGKRDSNSRPQPWQGCALPTELFPRAAYNTLSKSRVNHFMQIMLLIA